MDAPTRVNNFKERWKSMPREQKFALGVLCLCGILVLGLSAERLRTQIHEPFLVSNGVLDTLRAFNTQRQAAADQTAALQKKDTDHDGLSDYIEQEVYHTSAYLADSDSDGVPDSVEIAQGEDPNCPRGRSCYQAVGAVVQQAASTTNQEFLNVTQVPVGAPDVNGTQVGTSTSGGARFLENPPPPSQMTPAAIRDYLTRNNLVTQQQISQLDDTIVVQIYDAAYQEALKVQAAKKIVPTTSGTPAP